MPSACAVFRLARAVPALALAVVSVGCVSTLAPPRTVPAGRTRAYLVVEGGGKPNDTYLAPRPMVRHGLTQRVDAGLQFAFFMAGADLKWNAVRGSVDVAVDPGVIAWVGPSVRDEQALLSSSTDASGGSSWDDATNVSVGAPVLLGFNVARHFSLIALGGSNLVWRRGELPHVLYRVGAGVHWHSRWRFAMQMEIDALYDAPRGVAAERPAPIFIGGLGLVFGHESEYDDVDGRH